MAQKRPILPVTIVSQTLSTLNLHLTPHSTARPCQRCIKRDLATTCVDATRKKAKYLQDIDTSQDIFSLQNISPYTTTPSQTDHMSSDLVDTSQLFNFSLTDLGFGSETAGLEYGFIGNMLQNPLDLSTAVTSATAVASTQDTAAIHLANATSGGQQMNLTPTSSTFQDTVNETANAMDGLGLFGLSSFTSPQSLQTTAQPLTPVIPQTTTSAPVKKQTQQMSPLSSTSSTLKRSSTTSVNAGRRRGVANTPEEAYMSVRRPFNYAEGFHYLIQYVRAKMGRDDLMRISRALALFRPSFLALIMNLTEEDLIFMEKCIQRTLLEYEKLISFSGTPTVVWRRTGEVCLVGKEFSLLTQWTKDMLLNKKTYIYELMDNQSAVEYWEKFSTHAFDNTDKSCIYSCILRSPQQKPVPCTFCFTIKRDIFDLPSVIVGNFLPILS
ncbi:Transcriptional regulator of nonfermentable carbon utilization [Apophysomyces ossiformis]|uniref:Transcriptional regulator of nonfermentable carbon utilization n=1 Tax=Apophysomyces ossiformis TaxID=679940 RepID=A0A8H7BSW9_9FUNG|nr:Transcriptional regulator of nonfermentable carbon utilization [Apophysomyces ossiformis]